MAPKTPKKWPPEKTKFLVSCYELQPVLYKIDNPSYHNKYMRNSSLTSIKSQLEDQFKEEFTIEEIQKKINNLRTQFLEHDRQLKNVLPSGSGTDDHVVSSWWLYEYLLFLKPYCKRDKGVSNLKNISTSSLNQQITIEDNISEEVSEIETQIPTEIENIIVYTEENDDSVYYVEQDRILSPSSNISTNTSTQSTTPTLKASATPKIPKRIGRKRKNNEQTVDDTITTAINSIVAENKLPPHIHSFIDFIGQELSLIKNNTIYNKCKWKIIQLLQECQEDDKENE